MNLARAWPIPPRLLRPKGRRRMRGRKHTEKAHNHTATMARGSEIQEQRRDAPHLEGLREPRRYC